MQRLSSDRGIRSTLFSTVAAAMVLASPGCDVIVAPGGPTIGEFDLEGPMVPQCPATGDVVGVDTFLAATAAVHDAARSVQSDARAELEALAEGLGLAPSASSTLRELAAQVNAAMLGSLEGKALRLEIVHEAVSCVLDTDMASAAAAGCDPAADVGARVECQGTCVGTAGARLECDGDAVLNCEVDTSHGTCGTDCIGTCAHEVLDEACAGACLGLCEGTCTAPEADGSCSGACVGQCWGMCGLVSSGGACAGTCVGDCVSAPQSPGCEEAAVPMCVPGLTGVVECGGRCRGAVAVPGLVDACTASVAALANATLECVPPFSQAHAAFAADLNEPDAAALQMWADDVAASMSTLLAAQAFASALLETALSPEVGLSSAVEGLTSAAASTNDPCVAEQLEGAAAMLRDLPAGLEDVVEAVGTLEAAQSGG